MIRRESTVGSIAVGKVGLRRHHELGGGGRRAVSLSVTVVAIGGILLAEKQRLRVDTVAIGIFASFRSCSFR